MNKRNLKITVVAIWCALVALCAGQTSCSKGSSNNVSSQEQENPDPRIEKLVSEMERGLDLSKQQFGDLVADASVKYEKGEILINLVYDFSSAGMDASALENMSVSQLRASMIQTISGADADGAKHVGEILKETNTRIVVDVDYGKGVKKHLIITGNDLLDSPSDPDAVMDMVVAQISQEIPSMRGQGGIIDADVFKEGKTIVIEATMGVPVYSGNETVTRNAILEALKTDPTMKAQATVLSTNHISMCYRYVGTNGRVVNVVLTPSDLKRLAE